MVTRLELRNSLRIRLQDEGTLSPLWTDAQCNEFLAQALREYGRWEPAQAAASVVVAPGATSITAPVAVTGPVVRVRDGAGNDVPPMTDGVAGSAARMAYHEQAWRLWAGSIVLQRAVGDAEAGDWALDYLAQRVWPSGDSDPVPIEPGREPVVVALGAWQGARHREMEDYKRGAKMPTRSYAQVIYDEAAALFKQGDRRLRSGTLRRV